MLFSTVTPPALPDTRLTLKLRARKVHGRRVRGGSRTDNYAVEDQSGTWSEKPYLCIAWTY